MLRTWIHSRPPGLRYSVYILLMYDLLITFTHASLVSELKVSKHEQICLFYTTTNALISRSDNELVVKKDYKIIDSVGNMISNNGLKLSKWVSYMSARSVILSPNQHISAKSCPSR